MGNRLFGTNGVRGIVGETMNTGLALLLGRAVGSWLQPGDRIAIGTDARLSGDMLKAAFAAGVQAGGVDVVDLGVLPSPGIQLWVKQKGLAAGAIITASHNPPQWNGIKLIAPDGTETSQEEEAAVEQIYFSGRFRQVAWDEVGGTTVETGAVAHYVDAVLAQVDAAAIQEAGLKVVLDPGGGAGCEAGPLLMERLGVKVVPLSCDFDGSFKDRPSEPTPENAARAMAEVKASGADLGILQDGDADRAVFIDEKGDYVWGDTALALAALHELQRHPEGSIVCTAISSSTCVHDAVERAGGRLAWTVVGSPVVAREMIRRGAVFGGEDNGGFMFARHQVCRDGLMAMAFMLELLAKTHLPFSQLCAEIPKYALVKEKVMLPEKKRHLHLHKQVDPLVTFKERVLTEPDVHDLDDRDGVKAYLEDGWVLVRPSGTEPLIRVQAEAETQERAQAIADRFRAVLEEILGGKHQKLA